MAYDPRYFTTYYAINAINFRPVNVSSALDTLEGPYLPLVVQEAAGLPLDPSFRRRWLPGMGSMSTAPGFNERMD